MFLEVCLGNDHWLSVRGVSNHQWLREDCYTPPLFPDNTHSESFAGSWEQCFQSVDMRKQFLREKRKCGRFTTSAVFSWVRWPETWKMSWSSCLAALFEGCSVAWVVQEEWPMPFFLWALWQFQEIVHLVHAYPSTSSQLEIFEKRAGYPFFLGVALKISLVWSKHSISLVCHKE